MLLTSLKPSSITTLSAAFYQKPKELCKPNVSALQVPWLPSQAQDVRWALRAAACNLESLFVALHPVSSMLQSIYPVPTSYLTWFALSQFWPHSESLIPWFFTQLTFFSVLGVCLAFLFGRSRILLAVVVTLWLVLWFFLYWKTITIESGIYKCYKRKL